MVVAVEHVHIGEVFFTDTDYNDGASQLGQLDQQLLRLGHIVYLTVCNYQQHVVLALTHLVHAVLVESLQTRGEASRT